MNADTNLVFRKVTGRLWEDLWEMSRALTADAGGSIATGIN